VDPTVRGDLWLPKLCRHPALRGHHFLDHDTGPAEECEREMEQKEGKEHEDEAEMILARASAVREQPWQSPRAAMQLSPALKIPSSQKIPACDLANRYQRTFVANLYCAAVLPLSCCPSWATLFTRQQSIRIHPGWPDSACGVCAPQKKPPGPLQNLGFVGHGAQDSSLASQQRWQGNPLRASPTTELGFQCHGNARLPVRLISH